MFGIFDFLVLLWSWETNAIKGGYILFYRYIWFILTFYVALYTKNMFYMSIFQLVCLLDLTVLGYNAFNTGKYTVKNLYTDELNYTMPPSLCLTPYNFHVNELGWTSYEICWFFKTFFQL